MAEWKKVIITKVHIRWENAKKYFIPSETNLSDQVNFYLIHL